MSKSQDVASGPRILSPARRISNLRQIDTAKQEWALANKKQTTDTPTAQELETYLHRTFNTLKCPAGGVYTINAVGEKPTCSIPQHDLSGTTTGNSR